ncbi:cardiolipin synthase [Polaribacter aestuariivivens]|uniref:Cardiolipin synthase n=1 Tax=Polaribacter aestuariivivens TaxID=2304626 RepID=A0A5S3N1L5_9FLAO|nr:cardiolipin synthase [Polaribacter aestuariivivens]TMM28632.1 cardiolipin synthase [Polaribacter aestuariivivens]
MIYYILLGIHLLLFSWAFYNILYFGVKPSKSLSWILITFFFPFLGIFAFVIFGINRRRLKFFELKETKKRKNYIKSSFTNKKNPHLEELHSEKAKKISSLIYNNTNIPLNINNKVTVLKNGKETFDELYKAIEKAESFIHLQYYIIENGEIFNKLKKLLLKKRKENIEVRILYDAIGSYYLNKKDKNELKEAGCKIHPEMALKFGTFLFTLNFRNHRKIAVIDNKIGFTGGVNISDEYITEDTELGIWQDAHVKIEGDAVDNLHKSFIKDYFYATDKDLSKEEKYTKAFKVEENTKLQIVSSGPDYEQSVVMQQYLSFINLAEKNICVMNPYFIPTFSILEAFKVAALSGIKVQLLLPKRGDSKVATYSMYSYFVSLLKAGVEIYLRDDFSHSKVVYIDDEIASIGSTNFDCRSFEHNYELNAIIFDKKATTEIKNEFEMRIEKAHKIDLETFLNRSNKQKTLERLCRFFSPLL